MTSHTFEDGNGVYYNGDVGTNVEITGTTLTEPFDENTTDEIVERNVLVKYVNISTNVTVIQHAFKGGNVLSLGENYINNSTNTQLYEDVFGYKELSEPMQELCYLPLYSFTPDESGQYSFIFLDDVDGGSGLDTYAYLIDMYGEILCEDDDSNHPNSPFDPCFDWYLEEGETCYFSVKDLYEEQTHEIKGILAIYKDD